MNGSFARSALFVDGQYLASAAEALGFEVDFRILLDRFGKNTELVRAKYYSTMESQLLKPRPLLDWLAYNGYDVIERSEQFARHIGVRVRRPRIDLLLATDALELASRIDHAIFITGAEDLRPLLAAVQRQGVHVTLVGTLRARGFFVADELRRQTDTFIELAELGIGISRPAATSTGAGEPGVGTL